MLTTPVHKQRFLTTGKPTKTDLQYEYKVSGISLPGQADHYFLWPSSSLSIHLFPLSAEQLNMNPVTFLAVFAAAATTRQLNCCPVGYTFKCCESSVPNNPADEHRTGIDCKSLYLVVLGSLTD